MLKTLMTGALALSLLGGATAASAHPSPAIGVRIEHVDYRDHDRGDRRDFRDHRFDHRDYGRDYGRYGWNHRWVRGERFYPAYGSFVVNDWNRYHLRRPPYGYHWVNYNGDYLLVAIGTGIIADMLLNQYYAPY